MATSLVWYNPGSSSTHTHIWSHSRKKNLECPHDGKERTWLVTIGRGSPCETAKVKSGRISRACASQCEKARKKKHNTTRAIYMRARIHKYIIMTFSNIPKKLSIGPILSSAKFSATLGKFARWMRFRDSFPKLGFDLFYRYRFKFRRFLLFRMFIMWW